MYYIQPSLASDDSVVRCQECFLYIYTGVGLSALLVSTGRAMRRPLHCGTSDRTGSTLLICVYSTIFIISHIGVWWHLIIADMEYCLNYIFKGKHYTTKYILPLKASTNQLEAIAQGLALTSAEQNNHKSYGRYTDMNLFADGILVWHSPIQRGT